MQKCKSLSAFRNGFRCGACVLLVVVPCQTPAATLWTGPSIVWTKSPSDTVLAGEVVLTRANGGVLFNKALGESSPGVDSPKGTEWAFGSLSNYSSLTYPFPGFDAEWRPGRPHFEPAHGYAYYC